MRHAEVVGAFALGLAALQVVVDGGALGFPGVLSRPSRLPVYHLPGPFSRLS